MPAKKKEKKKPDFKALDAMVQFTYKDDLYVAVESHGYKYVSELVYDHYYTHDRNLIEISDLLDKTPPPICFWMERWGWARRPGGGNNKNKILNNVETIKKIKKCKGKITAREASIKANCSMSTIYNIWRKK
jgi:hypothetical protein